MSDRQPLITCKGDGVYVIHSDGAFNDPVEIRFSGYDMSIDNKEARYEVIGRVSRFNFYELYPFTQLIGERMSSSWAGERGESPFGDKPLSIVKWGARKAAQFAGRAVHKIWKEHLRTVDPNVLNLHKAIFAADFGRDTTARWIPIIETNPDIYKNSYLIQDAINNRAAAIVLSNLGRFITEHCDVIGAAPSEVGEVIRERLMTDKWDYWPALLSSTGQPYTSLTKTLMNLPGGIPGSTLGYLSRVHLDRPVTNRRELLALLLAAMHRGHEGFIPVFLHSNSEQIKKAICLASEYVHRELSPNRTNHLRMWVDFIMDYPDDHNGNVVGLTKKAIHWHAHRQDEIMQQAISRYGGNQKLALPPIELPADKRVRFLSTIDDLCLEKDRMQHCIISYAEQAMAGYCYLFHVEHNGEHATVEVSPQGRVVQSQGPRNTENKATRMGKRILNAWGKKIPTGAEPIVFPQRKELRLEKASPFLDGDMVTVAVGRIGEDEIPF